MALTLYGYSSVTDNDYTVEIVNKYDIYPIGIELYPFNRYKTVDNRNIATIDKAQLIYQLDLYNEDFDTICNIFDCDQIQLIIGAALYPVTIKGYTVEWINNVESAKHMKIELFTGGTLI